MTEDDFAARSRLSATSDLSAFCEELFASLPRSDQRRWGEVYIRGLLSVRGRKSIRRISDEVVGWRADQCLQQFVNQSPWRWDAVRSALAHRVSAIRPRAWLIEEAAFPKNGSSSVGVARQYAPTVGRTINCQLGLAVVLANGDDRCAVNWRLLLPRTWDTDVERRKRARLPDGERHRPPWRHVFDAVDEMAVGWGLRPAPVVWDSAGQEARPLLRGLAARQLPYLVRVAETTPVVQSESGSGLRQVSTAEELAELSVSRRQVMLRVPDRSGAGAGAQYSMLSICDICPPERRVHITSTCPHRGTRRVLAQWSCEPTVGRLSGVWLTNLTNVRLAQLVDLVELSQRARHEDMTMLRDEFGLQDFEGRSFAGWHHHMTLVSAAHAYQMLRRTRGGRATGPTPRLAMSGPTYRFVSKTDGRAGRPEQFEMEECLL
ncbi:MAG TPA: transposase [Actinophytocola sp.]|nr:transposase [Actinophytocola sp.]HEV2780638.1 transposase [Actinophytocola sp.]